MNPATYIGFSRRAWDRLHPVGRPYGFRWVQTWRGERYRVLSLVSEVNPATGRMLGPSAARYLRRGVTPG